jgi:hypothetical protein
MVDFSCHIELVPIYHHAQLCETNNQRCTRIYPPFGISRHQNQCKSCLQCANGDHIFIKYGVIDEASSFLGATSITLSKKGPHSSD